EFFKDINTYFGFNVNDFTTDKLFGFISSSYDFTDKNYVFIEYDNIRFSSSDRLNAGVGFKSGENFKINFLFRNLTLSEGKTERAVVIEYLFGD
ncbi:MAG: hypothetical protein NZ870_04170, partial [bacterium]|nr:hypothetical protein [bacterium]